VTCERAPDLLVRRYVQLLEAADSDTLRYLLPKDSKLGKETSCEPVMQLIFFSFSQDCFWRFGGIFFLFESFHCIDGRKVFTNESVRQLSDNLESLTTCRLVLLWNSSTLLLSAPASIARGTMQQTLPNLVVQHICTSCHAHARTKSTALSALGRRMFIISCFRGPTEFIKFARGDKPFRGFGTHACTTWPHKMHAST
jgi:hypothetical protein